MAQASQQHAVELERLSFKGSVDSVRQFSIAIAQARSKRKQSHLIARLLECIAKDEVPDRPGRREPRAVKLATFTLALVSVAVLSSCVSSIVGGEYSRLSTATSQPKPDGFDVPVLTSLPAEKKAEVIALVTARAYLLDKAVAELKKQARRLGADALIDFKQERHE